MHNFITFEYVIAYAVRAIMLCANDLLLVSIALDGFLGVFKCAAFETRKKLYRGLFCVCPLLIATAMHGSKFFEFNVKYSDEPGCEDWYHLTRTDLFTNTTYAVIWKSIILAILDPFCEIFWFTCLLVITLKRLRSFNIPFVVLQENYRILKLLSCLGVMRFTVDVLNFLATIIIKLGLYNEIILEIHFVIVSLLSVTIPSSFMLLIVLDLEFRHEVKLTWFSFYSSVCICCNSLSYFCVNLGHCMARRNFQRMNEEQEAKSFDGMNME